MTDRRHPGKSSPMAGRRRPTRRVQGQLVIAPGIKAAAWIAEFVLGAVCEQRQLIKYLTLATRFLTTNKAADWRDHECPLVQEEQTARCRLSIPNRSGSGIRRSASSNRGPKHLAAGHRRPIASVRDFSTKVCPCR